MSKTLQEIRLDKIELESRIKNLINDEIVKYETKEFQVHDISIIIMPTVNGTRRVTNVHVNLGTI